MGRLMARRRYVPLSGKLGSIHKMSPAPLAYLSIPSGFCRCKPTPSTQLHMSVHLFSFSLFFCSSSWNLSRDTPSRRVFCLSRGGKKALLVGRGSPFILARCFTISTWRTHLIVVPGPCPGDERRLRERVNGVEPSGSNVGRRSLVPDV